MILNRMKQYIEHDGIKRAFVIKQVERRSFQEIDKAEETDSTIDCPSPVSYTHLRAHETEAYLVCRLLLEKNFF